MERGHGRTRPGRGIRQGQTAYAPHIELIPTRLESDEVSAREKTVKI